MRQEKGWVWGISILEHLQRAETFSSRRRQPVPPLCGGLQREAIIISEEISMSFEKFYTYDQLTEFLRDAHEKFPQFTELESIGKSYEGRDIWALTVTNFATGEPDSKPAMYIDGNIHAGEVTGCAVCMYTIQYLLNNYSSDEMVSHLLDTRTFYVLPRVNPDGAEVYLTSEEMLRSSVRPNPDFEMKTNHLYPEDINGDGEILTMRVPDPAGPYKISSEDPRVMVPREPDEFGGEYYSLYPEGTIHDYEGGPFNIGPRKYNLDINRNFPADWSPTQSGAGRYPLSEPETRAMVDFILEHKNIATLQAYHTFAGIILRPSCTRPDAKMDQIDLRAFESIGERGTEVTQYPVRSVYHGFTRDRGQPRHGVFIDWVYEHLGVVGYTTELWDKHSKAGIDREYGKPLSEKQRLKLIQWHDEEQLDAFRDWEKFDHPQLGEVEIGGFAVKTFQQNTPFKYLKEECRTNTLFSLRQAAATPRLSIDSVEVTDQTSGLVKISVDVRNEGYLPTNVTNKAVAQDAVNPVVAVICGDGVRVLDGDKEQEIGHIDGYMKARLGMTRRPVDNASRVSWLVDPQDADKITVEVKSDRAGTVKTSVKL